MSGSPSRLPSRTIAVQTAKHPQTHIQSQSQRPQAIVRIPFPPVLGARAHLVSLRSQPSHTPSAPPLVPYTHTPSYPCSLALCDLSTTRAALVPSSLYVPPDHWLFLLSFFLFAAHRTIPLPVRAIIHAHMCAQLRCASYAPTHKASSAPLPSKDVFHPHPHLSPSACHTSFVVSRSCPRVPSWFPYHPRCPPIFGLAPVSPALSVAALINSRLPSHRRLSPNSHPHPISILHSTTPARSVPRVRLLIARAHPAPVNVDIAPEGALASEPPPAAPLGAPPPTEGWTATQILAPILVGLGLLVLFALALLLHRLHHRHRSYARARPTPFPHLTAAADTAPSPTSSGFSGARARIPHVRPRLPLHLPYVAFLCARRVRPKRASAWWDIDGTASGLGMATGSAGALAERKSRESRESRAAAYRSGEAVAVAEDVEVGEAAPMIRMHPAHVHAASSSSSSSASSSLTAAPPPPVPDPDPETQGETWLGPWAAPACRAWEAALGLGLDLGSRVGLGARRRRAVPVVPRRASRSFRIDGDESEGSSDEDGGAGVGTGARAGAGAGAGVGTGARAGAGAGAGAGEADGAYGRGTAGSRASGRTRAEGSMRTSEYEAEERDEAMPLPLMGVGMGMGMGMGMRLGVSGGDVGVGPPLTIDVTQGYRSKYGNGNGYRYEPVANPGEEGGEEEGEGEERAGGRGVGVVVDVDAGGVLLISHDGEDFATPTDTVHTHTHTGAGARTPGGSGSGGSSVRTFGTGAATFGSKRTESYAGTPVTATGSGSGGSVTGTVSSREGAREWRRGRAGRSIDVVPPTPVGRRDNPLTNAAPPSPDSSPWTPPIPPLTLAFPLPPAHPHLVGMQRLRERTLANAASTSALVGTARPPAEGVRFQPPPVFAASAPDLNLSKQQLQHDGWGAAALNPRAGASRDGNRTATGTEAYPSSRHTPRSSLGSPPAAPPSNSYSLGLVPGSAMAQHPARSRGKSASPARSPRPLPNASLSSASYPPPNPPLNQRVPTSPRHSPNASLSSASAPQAHHTPTPSSSSALFAYPLRPTLARTHAHTASASSSSSASYHTTAHPAALLSSADPAPARSRSPSPHRSTGLHSPRPSPSAYPSTLSPSLHLRTLSPPPLTSPHASPRHLPRPLPPAPPRAPYALESYPPPSPTYLPPPHSPFPGRSPAASPAPTHATLHLRPSDPQNLIPAAVRSAGYNPFGAAIR
ncbi:hypothetical protein HETIRDRAFT_452570 [Heterobasidion irregulare TC 32-1]|uniref:Uncharacterized protein n=1 Tax=Heterobasidion irregulare (strain TC 32-1) TaxID=747525 RepID=W4K5X6_HETIT|nr:uncharacterized protein HETIRDRAFT_452570 [Heterobasidion irregulare TC 32-1]ETW81174.1 hypothetical protein HETIRDRAFT_452570 [Heterobasidion irregulare TC 32-1]